MKKLSNYIILFFTIGSLISSLLYLSVGSMKYSHENAFVLFGNPVMYISAYSAWFFSDFLWIGIVQYFSLNKINALTLYFVKLHSMALCIRGSVYLLQYLEILPAHAQHRLAYLLGYVFLLSLVALFNYNLTPKETYD